jgi:hypothetical protein
MTRSRSARRNIIILILVSSIILIFAAGCGSSVSKAQSGLTPAERKCLLTLVSGPKSPPIVSPVHDLIAIYENDAKVNDIQPGPEDLAKIDELISKHRYSEVHHELEKLQEKYPASFEIFYRDILSFVLELNWARSLPVGDQRCESQTRFDWHDHLGLICQGTEAYIRRYDQSNRYYNEMQGLNEIARTSLKDLPCKQTIMEKWDQDRYISRLPGTADFALKIEKLSYQGSAQ